MSVSTLSRDAEARIAEGVARYYDDPLGFVMFAYPWGQVSLPDGSANPLREKHGPEPWQRAFLNDLGAHIRQNIQWTVMGFDQFVWRSARASGHGVGKSALVSWLIQFFMSTRRDVRGIVTANTASQLETKTWPELAKWHRLLINKHWFTWTATTYYFSQYPEDQRKNYMFNAATVSVQNTEAFAGLHNEGKAVVVLFDEASGIESKIWEVADGALTDGEGFFCAFGNPTEPMGPFADCFDKHSHLFNCAHVDSREVSFTNKTVLFETIQKYGEDDDVTKVRVYGQFPSQSYNGFISLDTVLDCIRRELTYDPGAPLIMGVDVARFGDDESVIGFRQGRDARSRPFRTFKGINTVKLARIIADVAALEKPDAIVIESTGPGAGVIDVLRDNHHLKVIEVHPGAKAQNKDLYYRKRDELWHLLRDWMIEHGCISDDPVLQRQLVSIRYTLDRMEQRTKLESKEEMKKRTLDSSPDRADSLALTFGVKLARRDSNLNRRTGGEALSNRNTAVTDYDVHNYH